MRLLGRWTAKKLLILTECGQLKKLPISIESLPDRTELGHWKFLSGLTLPKINSSDVELLIGSDIPEAFWVEDERRGNRGEPYAVRLKGWTVMGPTAKN